MRKILLTLFSIVITTISFAQISLGYQLQDSLQFNRPGVVSYIRRMDSSHIWAVNTRGNPTFSKVVIYKINSETFAFEDSLVIAGKNKLNEAEVDDDGNLYVCGRVDDTLQFGSQYVIYPNDTVTAGYLAKIDPQFQVEWLVDSISFAQLGVSPNGNHLYARSPMNYYKAVLHKINAQTGAELDTVVLDIPYAFYYDVAASNNGELYISASCASSLNGFMVDTVFVNSNTTYNQIWLGFDNNMQCRWGYAFEDFTCYYTRMLTDDQNHLLTFGPLNREVQIGGVNVGPTTAAYSFQFSSVSADGTVNYINEKPDSAVNVIARMTSNWRTFDRYQDWASLCLYQTGDNSTIDWGYGQTTQTDQYTGAPILLEYYSTSGIIANATAIDSFFDYSTVYDISYINQGDLMISLRMKSGNYSPYLLHYKEVHVVGVEEKNTVRALKAYPNPAQDKVTFNQVVTGDVYTITGAHVKQVNQTQSIDIGTLNAGMYFFRTEDGQTIRLVKE